jgi:uncharacterized lipoprotein YddW (UPF0748 family)
MWVVRDALLSHATLVRLARDASAAGITDLFVQVRGRGDAYYASNLAPLAPELARLRRTDPGYDPLAVAVELGHQRGLRVHAWLNVYLVGGKGMPPNGHVLQRHPEWAARNARGVSMGDVSYQKLLAEGVEGVYLEPGTRGVVRDFLGVVDEILGGYEVDGIHLDYVRYPDMDVGYGEAMRAGFQRRTGLDPLELAWNRKGIEAERGAPGLLDVEREWRQFKADQVSALVRETTRLVRQRRPQALVSAAVKADPHAAFTRNGQEWDRWVREGWIDVVVPMMYSTSTSTVRQQAREAASVAPPHRVWGGVAVYNQSLTAAAAKIAMVRQAGLGGYALFSYNSLPGGGASLAQLGRER